MLKGYPPFSKAVSDDLFYSKVESGDWNSFWQMHYATDRNSLAQSFKDLIQGMLEPAAGRRWTLDKVLNSKWLASVTAQ